MSTPRYLFSLEPDDHLPERPVAEPEQALPEGPEVPPRGRKSQSAQEAEAERALTVTELTEWIKEVLEVSFPSVWVAGEVCNLSRPQSGHCYLTLKDDTAQISAVMWRAKANRLRFDLHDGLEVVCRGRLEVYGPRGKYQLVIEELEPKGIGALELALRQLRDRLAREGLFDPARKRRLPRFVRRIAVVTSPTGAAIRDFLEVLRRRWCGADVLVVPVRVQGDGAAQEIAAAIGLVNRLPLAIDCLVVTRGGGSLEDLWAFNEEAVVRAICASRIPVVSGVGHEIDVTLADLAADVRALTPSEAAERVAPSSEELSGLLGQYRRRMSSALRSRVATIRCRIEVLAGSRALRFPLVRVHDLSRRLDELETRASRAFRGRLRGARQHAESLAARLESLSPLAVLSRGYSLTQHADGRVVRSAASLSPGDAITTRFAKGRATSRVESVEPEDPGTDSR